MIHSSERIREPYAESRETRRQIYEMINDGLQRKEVASRLGLSRQDVDYHLKFECPRGTSYQRYLQGQLANALTREAFLREALRISQQMYRRLWWETKSKLSAPTVKRLR